MPARAGVRDPSFPRLRLQSGAAFELVAELAALTSGPARASLESGKAWIRTVRALAGQDLIRRVERWAFPVYAELVSFALETAAPHDTGQLVECLRATPADRVRRRLLGADAPSNRAMVSEGAFERALAGDPAARAEVLDGLGLTASGRHALDRLLALSPEAVQDDVTAIVEDWASRVFPAFAEQALAVIGRDVAAKERQLEHGSSRDLLRTALQGVEVGDGPLPDEIILVPTLALRPFVAPVDAATRRIYICSVADESLDEDPSAPPRRLVKLASAMGDPLRLRILRTLADEELTASEIAQRLGIDRTTLHHHLGILRSAGLLSIRDDGVNGWRYARRTDGVAEATRALESYLGST